MFAAHSKFKNKKNIMLIIRVLLFDTSRGFRRTGNFRRRYMIVQDYELNLLVHVDVSGRQEPGSTQETLIKKAGLTKRR